MDLPSDLSEDRVYSWVLQVLKMENLTDYKINLDGSSARAEGFIGDIIFADVTGSDSNGQKKVLNLVIKIEKINVNLRDKFPMKNFSLREIFVYEEILPVFTEFQKERNILNPFESFPKCYQTMVFPDTEVIILENCKPLGYEVNNSKTLNLKQIKFVLKSFAQFHALSFALRDQKRKVFEALTFKFTSIFGMFLHDVSFRNFYRRSIDEAIMLLMNSNEIDLAEKLRKIMENDPVALIEVILQENCNEESVILHGDNWKNNFMFIHGESNPMSPIKMCMLDWQHSSLHSPVFDLIYFIYAVSSKEEISKFDELMEYYHMNLSEFLRDLGSDPQKLMPYSKLRSHLKKYSLYSFVWVVSFLKIFLCDKSDAPSSDDIFLYSGFADLFFDIKISDMELYMDHLKSIVGHFCSLYNTQ